MKAFRKHWFDIGGFLSILCIGFIILNFKNFSDYQLILWCSLVSLFWHQLEEYRFAGTFPGMINTVMFKSNLPDRFPLNTNTAMLINVFLGWLVYFLAAIFAEKAIWLGIAAILISSGNIIAHTFLFNIKGKTFYNAGLASCWLLFVPIIYYFFKIIFRENLASNQDWLIGIILGLILNYFGILKMIVWLSNKKTTYIFEQRNLLPKDRKSK
ncbi:HXXEE domain-containing protein [Halpernia sp.]|uniref:HXXEE domain-containing protein n=1 Tax=Halpernia sp. TaxID=2782209 RepID=UPI003A92286F